MPTLDEFDQIIADLEYQIGRLRTLRAIQLMQANAPLRNRDVIAFPGSAMCGCDECDHSCIPRPAA